MVGCIWGHWVLELREMRGIQVAQVKCTDPQFIDCKEVIYFFKKNGVNSINFSEKKI
jgi:hypothetical protein